MSEIFTEDSWISATIGIKSFSYCHKSENTQNELKRAIRNSAAEGDAFFYAKIPTDQLVNVSKLTKVGFTLVDTNVVLALQSASFCSEPKIKIEVNDAGPEHYLELQNIAESCFRYSRFHQDPIFPREIANLIKRKWIESYCIGKRGSALYVALISGKPVGFLAVLTTFDRPSVACIDLIGVKSDYQRQGVGRALVSKFIEQWKSQVDQLIVGTQITNRSSLALYADFGFRIFRSTYVMHAHAQKGLYFQ